MSYSTIYTMKIKGVATKADLEALLDEMEETGDLGIMFDFDKRSVTYNTRSHTANVYTWGEYCGYEDPHVIIRDKISRKHPEMTFAIYAEGEDWDDRMVYLIQNGEREDLYGKLKFTAPKKIAWKGDLTIHGV